MAPSEEEQRKLEEARRKAEEEESQRLEEEVARQTESLRKLREKKKEPARGEEERRKREEEERKRSEEEARRKAEEERRRREEEERLRQQEEERKRREEEEAHRRAEEEARRKAEEDTRLKAEEERKRKEEEERRRREEGERRKKAEEETRRRVEEETRRQREEEEKRRKEQEEQIQQTLQKAEEHLAQKEFDKALTEIGKILASQPMHAEALALDQKIRNTQAEVLAAEAEREKEAERAAAEEQAKAAEAAAKPVEEKVTAEEEKEKPAKPKKAIPKKAIIGAIAAVLVVGIAIAVFQMSRTLFEGKHYIAILPFTSQTNTEEEKVLGTALAEETATLLGYFPDARVMGASSAVNLQRVVHDVRAKANRLNFTHTVNGTISTSEATFILNVEIIDTLGNKVWAGKIEKLRDKMMELPTDLARTIAEAFAISLPQEAGDLLTRKGTSNAGAYTLYLRGREMLHKGGYAMTKSALDLFQQATAQDPNFAESYAARAHALFHMYEAGWSDDAGLLSQVEALAKKALGIHQQLAEAHTVLGGVFQLQKKYRDAIDALQSALKQMPSNTEAHRILGITYSIVGNEDKAMEHLKLAYELDPANVDVLTSIALMHQRFQKPKEAMAYFDEALPFINDTTTFLAEIAGNTLISSYQYDRAIKLYEQRTTLDPKSFMDNYKLARAYQLAAKEATVWSKAFEKTIALLQQELQQKPQNALAVAYLGLAYSRYGRFAEGETNGKKAIQMAPTSLTIKYKLADIYSIQKKKAEAIAALRDAVKNRSVLTEVVDLDLFNISDEPEFSQTITEELR